jgi:hypothetical protein
MLFILCKLHGRTLPFSYPAGVWGRVGYAHFCDEKPVFQAEFFSILLGAAWRRFIPSLCADDL